ncbi:MAG: CoA-binding protein [Chitinophagales bacterium]|nr:CoA-binding protein [Chitinophagaceae bacterium]MCB9064852.1 CoA-binding protein [Chitinophagales bacterium]
MQKKTLVLGASENPSRYSNIAINRLAGYKHPVVAIGRRAGNVAGVNIETNTPQWEGIDTVTLYLNPRNQEPYYDYILSLKPKRVIFNPGTENDAFEERLREQGIVAQEACTLVLLSTGQY